MRKHSDSYPWPPYYGHFKFFEERMKTHSQIASLTAMGGGVYELKTKYGNILKVFICECYCFGTAEYIETLEKLGSLNAILINSAWCSYTPDAKRTAREAHVGLFRIGDFMSALNKARYWEHLTEAEKEDFQKRGWP